MRNSLRQTRIGLVGGNGFIGSAILQALLRWGGKPRVLCGPCAKPRPIPEGIETVTCDLNDEVRLNSWATGLDVIIHAAGPPSVWRSFQIPGEYARIHVQGTTSLLQACVQGKIERLVYISSAEVYGRPEVSPVSETHRLQARSPYAATKIGAERMIEAYVESLGLKAVVLRPFSVYGPDPTPESLLATIIKSVQAGKAELRDLRPIRDYCYVEDLAIAVLRAISLSLPKLAILNIGSGKGTSVAEFAEIVSRCMGSNVIFAEEGPRERPVAGESFRLVADITRARDVLGWLPEVSLEEGIRRSVAAAACEASQTAVSSEGTTIRRRDTISRPRTGR
jgi:UDP-glucose 4-epimerase